MNTPLYRFWGKTPPKAGGRTPILARADVPELDDQGVAVMRIYDPIDSWGGDWGVSAKEFVAALDAIPDDATEIHLHLNSPGGEVWEAVTMLNALRRHKARVVARVDGLAASAASFLAAGVDELVMGRNTQLMIHDAWGLAVGNAAVMRDVGDRLDKLSDNLASVYAEKAGGDVATWRAAMLAESWYSPEESVAAGLADSVEGEAAADAKAFDTVTLFNHAGRDEAPAPIIPSARVEHGEPDRESPEAAAARDVRYRMKARRARLTAA